MGELGSELKIDAIAERNEFCLYKSEGQKGVRSVGIFNYNPIQKFLEGIF